ncbi:MAG: AAA family ATPase [Methanospirillum sp.]|nr:AAA family ATPase [Methanospirillum sp.]
MAPPFRVALSGKGGTGKTTTAALLIDALRRAGETPVLAVDADPNANLHEALGMVVTETLGSMREEAFTRSIPAGMSRHAYVRLRFRQVLVEGEGVDLVAMGRPEGTGCYCFSNDLLAECLAGLQSVYPFVVIDAEAGMEHIARGTIGVPDVLLIVSDPGARGMRTATRIRDIALSLGLPKERMFLVVNRVRAGAADVGGEPVPLIVEVPADPAVEEADLAARPIVSIPDDSPARLAIEALAARIVEMARGR